MKDWQKGGKKEKERIKRKKKEKETKKKKQKEEGEKKHRRKVITTCIEKQIIHTVIHISHNFLFHSRFFIV